MSKPEPYTKMHMLKVIQQQLVEIKKLKEKDKYNGWCNYETWCVSLWLNNNIIDYDWIMDKIADIKRNPKEIYSVKIKPGVRLSELIRGYIQDNNSFASSLYADLLNHSISRVNFQEIAKSFLEQ